MAATNKKVALITGANKGIGFETARQLGEKGYTVLLGARDESRGRAAAEKLAKAGLDAHAVKLDVTREADRRAVAALVAERYGKLDVLVNNAGVIVERGTRADTVPLETVRETFEANYFSLIGVTQALLPLIRKSDAGRIVNLSSSLGSLTLNADPNTRIPLDSAFTAYNATKAAVNMYTVILARTLKETPIKVNAADPGWVKTDMGGGDAQLEVPEGAKTSVALATLGPDGPTGGFFHLGERLPW